MTTITLGHIVFPAHTMAGWAFKTLTDWRGAPDSKQSNPPRSGSHGSFASVDASRESMVPSFDVVYVGASEAEALAAWDEITGMVGDVANILMTVEDTLHTTSRMVSVRSVTPEDHHGRPIIHGSIDTFAPDPLRYGAAVEQTVGLPSLTGGLTWPITWPITWGAGGSEGRVYLPNTGKAPSRASFEVSGGLEGGFSLVEVGTGREIRFEREIPVGSFVHIDQRTGRAWIDDPANDVSGYLTKAEWFATAPGGESVVQFNGIGVVTGTPMITGSLSPAFW